MAIHLAGRRDVLCQGGRTLAAAAKARPERGERRSYPRLHRPAFADQSFARLGAAEAQSRYRQVLREMRRYFEEMEVSPQFADLMERTDSNTIAIAAKVLLREDIGPRVVPSFEEWVRLSCETVAESDSWREWRMESDYHERRGQIQVERSFYVDPAAEAKCLSGNRPSDLNRL